MKILIVEDEPLVAADLKDKLDKLQYPITGIAESYDEALEAINQEKPELVLLDIELKGPLTGIHLSEELNKFDIPFIYISSIQDLNTYFKAKDTGPLKNLPKPVDILNLRNALLEIQTAGKASNKSIDPIHFFPTKDGIRERVDPESIVYLEAARSYCDVHLSDGSRITLSKPMGTVVKKLNNENFIQINKSYFINRKHIKMIRGNELKLSVGPYLRISDSFKDDFNEIVNIV